MLITECTGVRSRSGSRRNPGPSAGTGLRSSRLGTTVGKVLDEPPNGQHNDTDVPTSQQFDALPVIVVLGVLLRLAAYWVLQTPAGRSILRAPHEGLLAFHPVSLDLAEETEEARTLLDLIPPESPYASRALVTPPLLLAVLVTLSCRWPFPPLASATQDCCLLVLLLADCSSALILVGALRRLRSSSPFSRPDFSTFVERLPPEPENVVSAENCDDRTSTQRSATKSSVTPVPEADHARVNTSNDVTPSISSDAAATEVGPRNAYLIRVESLRNISSADMQLAAALLLNPLSILSTALLAQAPLKLPFLALAIGCSLAPDPNRAWSSLAVCCVGIGTLGYLTPLPTVASVAFLAGHLWAVGFFNTRTGHPPRQMVDKPTSTELLSDSLVGGVLPCIAGSLGIFGVLLIFTNSLTLINRGWTFKTYWQACVVASVTGRNLLPDLGIVWFPLTVVLKGFRCTLLACFHFAGAVILGPVYLRLFRLPFTALQAMLAILLLLQPRVSVADFSFLLAILIMDPYVLRECPELICMVVALPCCAAAFSAFTVQWIQRNMLNSNFPFFVGVALMTITAMSLNFYFKTSLAVHAGASSGRKHETTITTVAE